MPRTSYHDATRRLLRQYERESSEPAINEEAKSRFLSLCELADILFGEFFSDIEGIHAAPTEDAWYISAVAVDLTLYRGNTHRFFTLIQCADYLRFSKAGDDAMRIEFGVNDLWVAE